MSALLRIADRADRAVSSPLRSPPPYKRQVVEPEHAPSPTEVATSPVTAKSDGVPSDDVNNVHAQAIAAVVQRHLPAVLADLRTIHTKQSPGVARGPCIFCGRVDKHVPGCMFQDDEADAKCVAELMQRCLPDLLAEQLPAALEQTGEGKRRELSNPDSKQKQDRHLGNSSECRSRTIFHLVQLHMPAALADALPNALNRTLPAVLPAILPSLLPNLLTSILPDILPALFALPPSFTTSYDSSSFDSASASTPPRSRSQAASDWNLRQHDLTPLGASLLPHLLTSLRPQLQKMHARALARGVQYWQRSAFAELEDTVLGYKGELEKLRDEGVEEVRDAARDAVDGAVDGVREEIGGVEEELAEQVEDEVRRRGEKAVKDVRKAVQDAVRDAEQRDCGPRLASSARHRGRRRPGKGGYCGVGRRGEAA